MAKLMRAVQYNSYGGGVAGLKHVEIPVPTPGKGEVLLKVEATALNPSDWKFQTGRLRPLIPSKFPHTPCQDVAGEVVKVGPGVVNIKAGDKVIAMLSPTTGGGLAEYAVSKADLTVAWPPELSAAEAASLPVAGITAHSSLTPYGMFSEGAGLKLDGSDPRKNIVITAASGGVGLIAVQLAKLGNAHVTATCGARNMDLVKRLGADEVLDYKTPEGAALRSPSGKKYDFVIQCASAIPWSVFAASLCDGGKVIDLSHEGSMWWTFIKTKLTFSRKQMVPFYASMRGENMAYLAGLAKQGKLKIVIDSTFPLSEAGAAWAKSIDGHATGKIIVLP